MDVNASAIAFAQADPDLSNVAFSVQDARATTYENDFFDAIIEQSVLACMEKSDREVVITEVRRILKTSGIFSIVEFGISEKLKERYKSDALVTDEYGTVMVKNENGSESFRSHHFSSEEVGALINNHGFDIVWSAHPDFITRSGSKHPGHQYVAKKI
ncbi:MAG: class I SAM-dependent methyltransferase [Minisyncoccia bacterium]